MDLFPAHGDAYPAYRYYRYGGLVSRQPYEMDFMGGDSMDLPYLAVNGHARMAFVLDGVGGIIALITVLAVRGMLKIMRFSKASIIFRYE